MKINEVEEVVSITREIQQLDEEQTELLISMMKTKPATETKTEPETNPTPKAKRTRANRAKFQERINNTLKVLKDYPEGLTAKELHNALANQGYADKGKEYLTREILKKERGKTIGFKQATDRLHKPMLFYVNQHTHQRDSNTVENSNGEKVGLSSVRHIAHSIKESGTKGIVTKDIMRQTGYSRNHVCRTIRYLKDKDLVFKINMPGVRNRVYAKEIKPIEQETKEKEYHTPAGTYKTPAKQEETPQIKEKVENFELRRRLDNTKKELNEIKTENVALSKGFGFKRLLRGE